MCIRDSIVTLRCMINDEENEGLKWPEILPWALYCLRISPLNDQGVTPSVLMFGQNLSVPGSLLQKEAFSATVSQSAYLKKLVALMRRPLAPHVVSVSYTHLRAHETPEHLVCRLLLEKK